MVLTKRVVERIVVVFLFAGTLVLVGTVFAAWQTTPADSTQLNEQGSLGSDLPLRDTVKVLRKLAADVDLTLDFRGKKTAKIPPMQPESGGTVTKYFSEYGIYKITAVSMGEMWRSKDEYYFTFSDNELFLVRERIDQHLWPFYEGHDPRIRESVLNEFYIADGKVIDWIQTTTRGIRDTAGLYQTESKRLLDELDNYKKLLSD